MSIVVRRTEPNEYRLAANAFMVALMEAPATDEQWERSLPSWQDAPSFSAWDGDTCVGHGSHDLVDTTVPGGRRLSTSAVTRVGVLPTHRRRGIGTGLMEALIDDARQRDLVLMSLRASEATIYGRYGFGVAGEFCSATIDPARLGPLTGATTEGSFRILEPGEIADVVAPLYDRVAHRRPGVVTRPPAWVTRLFRPAIERSDPSFVTVHLDAVGHPDGYVFYGVKWSEGSTVITTGVGELHELFAASDDVELALWQYVLDIDLVTVWNVTRSSCRRPRPNRRSRPPRLPTILDAGRTVVAPDRCGRGAAWAHLPPGRRIDRDPDRRSGRGRQQRPVEDRSGGRRTNRRCGRPVGRDRDDLGGLPRWTVVGGAGGTRRRRRRRLRRDRRSPTCCSPAGRSPTAARSSERSASPQRSRSHHSSAPTRHSPTQCHTMQSDQNEPRCRTVTCCRSC